MKFKSKIKKSTNSVPRQKFLDSDSYWKKRYELGGTSGSGSYGKLATFKADFLNDFVHKMNIRSVIDYGCGDGNNASLFSFPTYLGLDISEIMVLKCRKMFEKNTNMVFLQTPMNGLTFYADLVISLDVIYHLVEDDIYLRYMQDLTESANRYLIIYSSNSDKEHPASHVKHRVFTDWLELNRPEFALIEQVENPFPTELGSGGGDMSFSDFYVFEKQPD